MACVRDGLWRGTVGDGVADGGARRAVAGGGRHGGRRRGGGAAARRCDVARLGRAWVGRLVLSETLVAEVRVGHIHKVRLPHDQLQLSKERQHHLALLLEHAAALLHHGPARLRGAEVALDRAGGAPHHEHVHLRRVGASVYTVVRTSHEPAGSNTPCAPAVTLRASPCPSRPPAAWSRSPTRLDP